MDVPKTIPASAVRDAAIHDQLLVRRKRLQDALPHHKDPASLTHLLQQVDDALSRIHEGTFGICETCHDTIEHDRLLCDPFVRNCLDHLSRSERQALERDLDLAFQVQRGLLPRLDVGVAGWSMSYRFQPAGPVSGDYVDVVSGVSGDFYFLMGDVSGKGVAASLLMANLHAIFRTLIPASLPLEELMGKANRLFCEGTLSTHFATLVCGRASANGDIVIANAGHTAPVVTGPGGVRVIGSTGLPVGMFCESAYGAEQFTLGKGESLVLITDGVTEARNTAGELYGEECLSSLAGRHHLLAPEDIIAALLEDVRVFRNGAPVTDDMTALVLRKV